MVNKTGMLMVLLVITAASVFGDAGKTGWWILRRAQSTKPQPITSVAAIRGDLSGVFYNPSLLGTIRQKEVFLLTESGIGSDMFGGVVYGHPLKDSGFSVGVVYYNSGKDNVSYMQGGVLQEASITMQSDLMAMASYGKKVSDSFFAGATLKIANTTVVQSQASTAFCLDLGIMKDIAGFTVSVAAQNLGSSSQMLNRADALPMSVWAGCSYGMNLGSNGRLGLGVDMPYIAAEGRMNPVLGVEYGAGKYSASLGYKLGVADSAVQLGLNMLTEKYDIGYAVAPSQYLSVAHRVSIGYRF